MSELLERLRLALAGRYQVEKELGQGGMATVFLAHDLRHDRAVAIKLFRPDLAHALGSERFLREIRTLARLTHPHILPLFDSGESDGLLYYVMPFITGESLAARLRREIQLPLDESLQIARDIASALEYAHERGIIHRDIKPDNILLGPTGALLADFGIAHAIEQSGEQRLTATGFAMGTPAYMSPEQCAGTGRVDVRSDIYSLGCVLFEMLVGEPPFTGPSVQAVLARHAVERVPSLRAVRDTVPPAVEVLVHRAMAKSPADRLPTARAFREALAPDRLVQVPTRPVPVRRRSSRWLVGAAAVLGVSLAAVLLGRLWFGRRSAPAPKVNPALVAVLPFSSPGDDTISARMGREMAALIAERLPGDGGPRAVSAGATVAAMDRVVKRTGALTEAAAIRTAGELGAGQFITGSVTSQGGRVSFSGMLKRTSDGVLLGRVEGVSGTADSLSGLADRLATLLLVEGSGLPRGHRAALASLPLPALRTYLAARRLFFGGHPDSALALSQLVLEQDSTCYPAAFLLSLTGANEDGLRLAGHERERMGPADLALLDAFAWPGVPGRSGARDEIDLWDWAVKLADDRPEEWFKFGEALFSHGPLLGIPGILDRARAAFREALRLEPGFVPALGYLIDLAAVRQDTAGLRELATPYQALAPAGPLADYYRWRIAVTLADRTMLDQVRARFDSLDPAALEAIISAAQLDGIGIEDALHAARTLWSRGGFEDDSRWALFKQREVALNRGHPAEAAAFLQRQIASTALRPRDGLAAVVEAIWWSGDTTVVSRWLAEPNPGAASSDPMDPYFTACGRGLWQVMRGDQAPVPGMIAVLRRARAGLADPATAFIPLCVRILEAELAARTSQPDAGMRLAALDSLAASAPPAITWLLAAANLSASRLWEAAGDRERALRALRRRLYVVTVGERRVLVALSTFFREEGRLAALTGDTVGAVQAWERYLALRQDPEPTVQPEVDRIRAELRTLQSAGQ